MTYDLGDVALLGIQITDSTGAVADAGAVTLTIYKPDGTIELPTVVHASTGAYTCDYLPALLGTYIVKWTATGANAGVTNDEFNVRDPFALSPFSLQEAKDHLNIKSATTDTELLRFMDTATDMAERYINQIVARRTFIESLTGKGSTQLFLSHGPILNVTSVVENGVTLDPSVYAIDNYQMLLRRTDYCQWSYITESIVVTYVAGYQLVPSGLVHHIKELLRHLWETQRGAIAVLGQKNDDGYDPRTGFSLPRRVREGLDLFKNSAIG